MGNTEWKSRVNHRHGLNSARLKKKRNHIEKSLGEMCQIVTIEHAAGDADFNFFVYVF